MTLRAFRVGVVGARKARQGVGEHLARFLHTAGARVVAVAGTTAATAAAAAAALAPHGIEATSHHDVAAMVRGEALDALVIASPAVTHEACLRLALEAGLHVLCEKPLLPPDERAVEAGSRLLDDFAAAGLLLAVNTQWRHAIGPYMLLHPDVAPRAARSFEMRLAPGSGGLEMIPDALPHPLAILDHLFPADRPGLRDLDVRFASPREAVLTFTHPGGASGVRATVRLATCEHPPRPASFGFDGRLAHRVITEPGYRLALRSDPPDAREVALPDPMEAVVRRFVERVRKDGPFPAEPGVRAGLVHLRDAVVAAARVAPGRVPG